MSAAHPVFASAEPEYGYRSGLCGAGYENRTRNLTLAKLCVTTSTMPAYIGGECGSRTHSTAHHHRRISNPMPYHPAHSPMLLLYIKTRYRSSLFLAGTIRAQHFQIVWCIVVTIAIYMIHHKLQWSSHVTGYVTAFASLFSCLS